MAKNNKKKHLAEKFQHKNKKSEKKVNPFEVKINKRKHNALNTRLAKFEVGRPGLSRSRGEKKRVKRLLPEYKNRTKVNHLVDRRIVTSGDIGDEEKEENLAKKFTMERLKHHRSNVYNLNDEDTDLTHYGQSLADIEKFDEPSGFEFYDNDDEDRGDITGDLVEEHFGGFLTKKKNDEEDGDKKTKSYQQKMDEIILDSKKRKREAVKEKRDLFNLQDKVDSNWNDLRGLLQFGRPELTEEESKIDDYTKNVNMMKMEARAQASDRMKSPEEIAREEQQKLEQLEADRLKRMKGIVMTEKKPTHRSADDLDDGYIVDMPTIFDEDHDTFGEHINPEEDSHSDDEDQWEKEDVVAEGSDDDEDDNEDDDDDDDDDDEDDDDDDVGRVENKLEEESNNEGEDADDSDEESEEEQGSDSEDSSDDEVVLKQTADLESDAESESESEPDQSDQEEQSEESSDDQMEVSDGESMSDLESSDGDDEVVSQKNLSVPNGKNDSKKTSKDRKKKDNNEKSKSSKKEPEEKSTMEMLQAKKEIMESARKELPYTFEVPQSTDKLANLLGGHSIEEQDTIIHRIRKSNHASLAEGNKEKLWRFFSTLLDHYLSLAMSDPPNFKLINKLTLHLYEMSQDSPMQSGKAVIKVISKKHQTFQSQTSEKGRGVYPGLDTLFLFKLISVLFPTSDFHHHVVTKTMLYMSQLLTHCSLSTKRDVCSGLFICNMYLEYISLSQRYVPEAVNFLTGILFLAATKEKNKLEPVLPPFRQFGKGVDMLLLESNARNLDVTPVKISDVFCKSNSHYLATDQFKVGILHQCLQLLSNFSEIYKDLPSFAAIFKTAKYFMEKLPLKKYPSVIKTTCTDLLGAFSCNSRPLRPLSMIPRRPEPIKQLTPKFSEKFDGRKQHKGDSTKQQIDRLVHKVKREKKSAMREVRKDMAFLSRVKIDEQIKKDKMREEKTKRILNHLADQEGDVKSLKRRKF